MSSHEVLWNLCVFFLEGGVNVLFICVGRHVQLSLTFLIITSQNIFYKSFFQNKSFQMETIHSMYPSLFVGHIWYNNLVLLTLFISWSLTLKNKLKSLVCLFLLMWKKSFFSWRFHYFTELVCKEERGFLQKGTCSLFTVAVINLDDLKRETAWSNREDSVPHGGSTTPHMKPDPDLFSCVRLLTDLSSTGWQAKNGVFTNMYKRSEENKICSVEFTSISQGGCQQGRSCVPLCGCCVWTFSVLTDTEPVWDGHYLWAGSGCYRWPHKEIKNLCTTPKKK